MKLKQPNVDSIFNMGEISMKVMVGLSLVLLMLC